MDCLLYRFSSPNTGPYLIGQHSRILFRVGADCAVGCFGLDSDARQLLEHIQEKMSSIKESENLGPQNVATLISNFLYKKRLYCTPIIIGLIRKKDKDGKTILEPYICSMDSLGAMTSSQSYAVIGTATASLYSLCESNYQAAMETLPLLGLTEKIMKLALQRDVMSGGKVNVLTITEEGIFLKDFDTHDV